MVFNSLKPNSQSKPVTTEAWCNEKGIRSIQSPSPEKMANMRSDLAVSGPCQNFPIILHTFDSFYSILRHIFRLLTRGILERKTILTFLNALPLLLEHEEKSFDEENIVPTVLIL